MVLGIMLRAAVSSVPNWRAALQMLADGVDNDNETLVHPYFEWYQNCAVKCMQRAVDKAQACIRNNIDQYGLQNFQKQIYLSLRATMHGFKIEQFLHHHR